MTKMSEAAPNSPGSATRCALHDLYYSGTCWKCVEELVAGGSTDVEARQEALNPAVLVEPPGAVPESVLRFLEEAKLGSQSSFDILKVCLDLAAFLMEKNAAYGDSALTPLRCVSKADASEQIRVRIDDKLSRLFRGQAGGEDALQDLVGYWVLLKIAEKRGSDGR
jgi:hypothetical protein